MAIKINEIFFPTSDDSKNDNDEEAGSDNTVDDDENKESLPAIMKFCRSRDCQ